MSSTPAIDWGKYEDSGTPKVDFSRYEDGAEEMAKPGILDREIPLTGYGAATLSGLQSIGRGIRDAAVGGVKMLDPHKQEGETALTQLPFVRMARGLVEPLAQIPQLPGTIQDINASDDPTTHYLRAAQETAGQGVGQALAALGTEAVARGPRAVNRIVPSTARAGRGINALEAPELHGTKPVSPQGAITTLSRFEQELAPTPSVKLHPLLEDFRQRMLTSDVAATHPEVAAQLEASGMPTQNPLTFKEARSFLKRMNEAIPGASKGIERSSLKATAEALDSDIHAMAEQSGFGPDYRRMTREYRRGKQIVRAADEAGPLVGGAIGYEVGSRMGQPLGGTVIGGMAGRAVGKPTLGRVARAIVERDAGAPRLSKPPTPPPDAVTPISPPAPPEAAMRRSSDQFMQDVISRTGLPRDPSMEQAYAQQQGRAAELAARYPQRYVGFSPAASPQEYTRILLDAKEGKIVPGEADRRIVRRGGKVSLRPLVRPPE